MENGPDKLGRSPGYNCQQNKNACENYGSQSILYYQGYGARTALRIMNRRFFNLLGGVSTLYGSICGGTGQAGQEMDMGERISHDPTDHLNSNVILIWGRNPAVTDIHLWKILLQARKKGTRLITIDPVTSKQLKDQYTPKTLLQDLMDFWQWLWP
jgi:anaerobic selenocysteine-containing dehydrogenase